MKKQVSDKIIIPVSYKVNDRIRISVANKIFYKFESIDEDFCYTIRNHVVDKLHRIDLPERNSIRDVLK